MKFEVEKIWLHEEKFFLHLCPNLIVTFQMFCQSILVKIPLAFLSFNNTLSLVRMKGLFWAFFSHEMISEITKKIVKKHPRDLVVMALECFKKCIQYNLPKGCSLFLW